MARHIAAVLVALCISPAWLSAQTMKITVQSADVYLSPSTGSPVIGHVPRGTVLEVTRNLGSWVKVPWPDGANGDGYVHVSKGTVSDGPQTDDSTVAPAAPPRPSAARGPAVPGNAPAALRTPQDAQRAPVDPVYVSPATHAIGVGGLIVAPNAGFGASARAWRRNRLGLQFDMSRYAVTSAVTPGRETSLQFEPSVLYSMPDRVTDYWWLRPYVGSGVSLERRTLASGTGAAASSVSDSSLGYHVFGGGEVTFASVPRVAISADVSYRWLSTPFAGFETNGWGFSVSGRWYVR